MAKRIGLVVVARGRGWVYAWPRDKWERLTEQQQQDVIAAQTALLSQNETQNRTWRRRSVRAQTSRPGASPHQGAG